MIELTTADRLRDHAPGTMTEHYVSCVNMAGPTLITTPAWKLMLNPFICQGPQLTLAHHQHHGLLHTDTQEHVNAAGLCEAGECHHGGVLLTAVLDPSGAAPVWPPLLFISHPYYPPSLNLSLSFTYLSPSLFPSFPPFISHFSPSIYFCSPFPSQAMSVAHAG